MHGIDLKMDVQREPNAEGHRASVVMSDKFLPYQTY